MTDLAPFLSARPVLDATKAPVVRATQDILKDRYQFHMSILKAYVRHAQCVENKDKNSVNASVTQLANKLIAKYNFGSKFLSELKSYVDYQFRMSISASYAEIRKNSGLNEHVFEQMVDELHKSNIVGDMSPRFRAIFR